MKNNYKNLIISGIVLAFSHSIAFAQSASNSNADLKSTAKMENTCLMSVDNINFGQVFAPLTSQMTSSQMRVQCSNNASYTIGLAYGGVYGEGTTSSGNYMKYSQSNGSENNGTNYYGVYTSTGVSLGDIVCVTNGTVIFGSSQTATLFGYNGAPTNTYIADTKKACTTNGTRTNTKPTGWVGAYNSLGAQYIGNPAYAYGVMNGGLKGNKLAYKITVPGDNSKVWNAGNSSYTSTGTGIEQIVAVNAQIVPANSTNLYPAQDMYTDTITAVISY